MEKTEKSLEEIKAKYEIIKKKYSLPGFNELAEDFDIEKSFEKESSFLLRDIRRSINEKLSAYLHLFETLMNPSAAPMFVFTMLKTASDQDKKEIEEIYKKIAKIEIISIKLDTAYSEDSEAGFIKKVFDEWQSLKKKINDLIERFELAFDTGIKDYKKAYFG